MSTLSLRHFERNDWSWLKIWFQDAAINRELGPLDDEWLEHVLADRRGVQLVAEQDEQPVAIIGVTWGDEKDQRHGIRDLAVHPEKRRGGIGSKSVVAVLSWNGHPPTNKWIAFADLENLPPQRMLIAFGWREFENDGKMPGFEIDIKG